VSLPAENGGREFLNEEGTQAGGVNARGKIQKGCPSVEVRGGLGVGNLEERERSG